jgi:hypothetical protein
MTSVNSQTVCAALESQQIGDSEEFAVSLSIYKSGILTESGISNIASGQLGE